MNKSTVKIPMSTGSELAWELQPVEIEVYYKKFPILWRFGLYLRRERIRVVIRKDVEYVRVLEKP